MAAVRDRVAIVLAGLVVLASLGAIGAGSPTLGSPTYLLLAGCAAAAYATALFVGLRSAVPPSGRFLACCLLLAVAFRVPLWLTEPGNDVFRYVWDARVKQAGYNPYVVVPADPAFARLHTEETRRINHPDLPSPYPAGAQLFFRFVYLFTAKAWGFKVALGICDVLVGLVLWRWLAVRRAPRAWVLAYAWNPLVMLTVAGEAHVDLAGALCLLASAYLLRRGRSLASVLSFVLAVSIKLWPVVLLPLFWRRVRLRDIVAGAMLFILLYLPYVTGGHLAMGSLGVFVDQFRFNDTLFVLTSAAFGPLAAAGLTGVAALAVAAVLQARWGIARPGTWAWPLAIALVLSPVVYPWYLVWIVPLALSVTTVPLLAWSLSVLGTYRVWYLSESGAPWGVPTGVLVFEFAVVACAAGAVVAARKGLARHGGREEATGRDTLRSHESQHDGGRDWRDAGTRR